MDLNINTLNIELTTNCNCKCFACTRILMGVSPNNIDSESLIKFLDEESLKNIEQLRIVGNSGDPIFHPEFKKIIDHVITNRLPTKARLHISTNGSIHNGTWWEDLAKALSKDDEVVFTLDGLEDTHKRHRQTDFKTVLRNMSAFINAGGSAIWQYIMFDYNEHQVEEAYELARSIGVSDFLVMSTNYCDSEHGFPSEKAIKKYANLFKPRYGQDDKEFKQVTWRHRCTLGAGFLYINSYGYVTPCCFITGYNKIPTIKQAESVWFYHELIKNYQDLHIMEKTFMSIRNHPFYKYVIKNVKKIKICQHLCDSKTFNDYDL